MGRHVGPRVGDQLLLPGARQVAAQPVHPRRAGDQHPEDHQGTHREHHRQFVDADPGRRHERHRQSDQPETDDQAGQPSQPPVRRNGRSHPAVSSSWAAPASTCRPVAIPVPPRRPRTVRATASPPTGPSRGSRSARRSRWPAGPAPREARRPAASRGAGRAVPWRRAASRPGRLGLGAPLGQQHPQQSVDRHSEEMHQCQQDESRPARARGAGRDARPRPAATPASQRRSTSRAKRASLGNDRGRLGSRGLSGDAGLGLIGVRARRGSAESAGRRPLHRSGPGSMVMVPLASHARA